MTKLSYLIKWMVYPVSFSICILFMSLIFLVSCGDDSKDMGPTNQAPTAMIVAIPEVDEGGGFLINVTVLLSGTNSTDPDGDPLTYLWELTPPAGSTATLNNTEIAEPQFIPDIVGVYTVKLTVSDGELTGEATENITVVQLDLVAEIRFENDITEAPVGSEVTIIPGVFEGSTSVISSTSLTYEFVSKPNGSAATFVDGVGIGEKKFTMDKPGTYEVKFTATDLLDASRSSTDTGTVFTSAPMNITFDPIFGKVGDFITVSGANLSTILADNVVKINGVAAAVMAATAYPDPTLTVQIAATFSTGTISVQLGSDEAVSTDKFYAYPSVTVSTFAGSSMGNTDDTGVVAQFNNPYGITYSLTGDKFYVTDQGNNTIREISIGGVVTTLAGDGTGAFLDGPVASAQFFGPQGITVNSSDVIYIADNDNNRIRRINSTHTNVFTLAGDGTDADLDGSGIAAQFALGLFDMVIDNFANIYVSTTSTDVIRKIDGGGVVTTFAGTSNIGGDLDATGPNAKFNDPAGLAIDSDNNIYVADNLNNKIKKITTDAVVTTIAGFNSNTTVDGVATASFNSPTGLVMDNANGILYIAEFGSHVIRQYIFEADLVLTIAGNPESAGNSDGVGVAARFNGPLDITMDGAGNLYVTDYNNHRIRKISFD